MNSVRLALGLFVVFGLFHWSATVLGSDRGQHGILVGTLVVAATALAQWIAVGRRRVTLRQLGLGLPRLNGLAVAAGIATLLLLIGFLTLRINAIGLTPYPGWMALIPGLFAQAGIAEEVLFRAYLFGNMRIGRTFWQAARLSMLPFVAVHLVLFALMPWPVALAAVLLSMVIAFPMARLFELGGSTIWAPALLHFVIQGAPKVIVLPEDSAFLLLVWMVASAVVPMLVFAVRGRLQEVTPLA